MSDSSLSEPETGERRSDDIPSGRASGPQAAPAVFQLKPAGIADDITPKGGGLILSLGPAAYWKLAPAGEASMTCVAIYESDEMMRGLLGEWLSHAGYHLHSRDPAPSSPQQPPDLVVMSVQMPKEEAFGKLRIVHAVHPGTPVIALSSQFRSGLSSTGAAAQVLGVTRVLAKPLTRSQLLAAVEGIIGAPPPH